MAQEPRRAPAPQKHPEADGPPDNKWKWLAGGVAALALIGGGVYAWRNSDQNQPERADYAYSDSVAPVGDEARSDVANLEAEPAAAPARPAQRQTARTTSPVPDADQPAEQVIGVGPTNIAYEPSYAEDNDIVVEGRRPPVWSRTPNASRLEDVYPAMALERGQEGEARVQCIVEQDGALDCTRIAETDPTFGRAALRVARMFRHAPQRADGAAAAGTAVNMRVLFRLEEDTGRRRS